jgi:hypothetical protein
MRSSHFRAAAEVPTLFCEYTANHLLRAAFPAQAFCRLNDHRLKAGGLDCD